MDYEKYRQAIANRVCSHCIDCSNSGKCTLTGEDRCGVEIHLEKIIEVVHSVQSSNIEDYIKVLREKVCSTCKNQNSEGLCQLRSVGDCGLDRYFALVVEAIEEADKS